MILNRRNALIGASAGLLLPSASKAQPRPKDGFVPMVSPPMTGQMVLISLATSGTEKRTWCTYVMQVRDGDYARHKVISYFPFGRGQDPVAYNPTKSPVIQPLPDGAPYRIAGYFKDYRSNQSPPTDPGWQQRFNDANFFTNISRPDNKPGGIYGTFWDDEGNLQARIHTLEIRFYYPGDPEFNSKKTDFPTGQHP